MVDRLKLRITIKLFFGTMTLNLSEGRIKGDTLAYKRGPIRLIRRLEQYILLPGGIKILRVVADINQYRNIGNCPAIFQIPFRIDRLVSGVSRMHYDDLIRLGERACRMSKLKPQKKSAQSKK